MTTAALHGHPTASSWTQYVQVIAQPRPSGEGPNWYVVLFDDATGNASHSRIVVLRVAEVTVVIAKTSVESFWRLTPFPTDLNLDDFTKKLAGHFTLLSYADTLDSALCGLSRKLLLSDVRHLRAKLRRGPWGGASWLTLVATLRKVVHPELRPILRKYRKHHQAVILPWLLPVATRALRMRALLELEPGAVLLALLQAAGWPSSSHMEREGRRLLEDVDGSMPLRARARAMLGLNNSQVLWFNRLAGNPHIPSDLLADLCEIVARAPAEIRPQTPQQVRSKGPSIRLAAEHRDFLFSAEMCDRLGLERTSLHRAAFDKTCAALLQRRAFSDKKKTRRYATEVSNWLRALDTEVFVAAHRALCSRKFKYRDHLFAKVAEYQACLVVHLPVFVNRMSECTELAWKLAGGRALGDAARLCHPQQWVAQNTESPSEAVLVWPTTYCELKRLGREVFDNCLGASDDNGRIYWVKILLGEALVVAIETGSKSLIALALDIDPAGKAHVAIHEHFGPSNLPPPPGHPEIAEKLKDRIASALAKWSEVPSALHWLNELRSVATTAAEDEHGWRVLQTAISLSTALLDGVSAQRRIQHVHGY